MRHFLITAAVAGLVLSAIGPARAKSIWLKCGEQVINLDSTKERFLLISSGTLYQGKAFFGPGQIDFEYQYFEGREGRGSKYVFTVDRKSLNYTKTDLEKYGNGLSGTGWRVFQHADGRLNPSFGKCSIMKVPPTAGNKI